MIEIPGDYRILGLVQVEAFGPPPAKAVCYKRGRYPDRVRYNKIQITELMESCATCTGEGPSQCTSCDKKHAFVAWRKKGAVNEGSCHDYQPGSTIRLFNIPGEGDEARSLKQRSFLSKFARTKIRASFPAIPSIGNLPVEVVDVQCFASKFVSCAPRLKAGAAVKCEVKKTVRLDTSHTSTLVVTGSPGFTAARKACKDKDPKKKCGAAYHDSKSHLCPTVPSSMLDQFV